MSEPKKNTLLQSLGQEHDDVGRKLILQQYTHESCINRALLPAPMQLQTPVPFYYGQQSPLVACQSPEFIPSQK